MGRDTSRDDMAYAVRLANRDYDAGMIFRALAAKPSGRREPGSVKYQALLDRKGRDAADAYARRTADKAIEFVAARPAIRDRPSAFLRFIEIQGVVGAIPWVIYAGAGRRRALEAAFVVAERIGSVSFGLALREWAEIAGQDERAMREHRDALVRLGWLTRNSSDRPGRTGRYALRVPPHIHSHGRSECAAAGDRAWLAHDAFRPAALGDLGWYTLLLTSEQTTLVDLSVRAGVDVDELRDLVLELDRARIVALMDGDAIARAPDMVVRLDDLATRKGTAGETRRGHEAPRRGADGVPIARCECAGGVGVTEDATTLVLAERFASAVAAQHLEAAEQWAEAAFTHGGIAPREASMPDDGDGREGQTP